MRYSRNVSWMDTPSGALAILLTGAIVILFTVYLLRPQDSKCEMRLDGGAPSPTAVSP